MASAPTSTGLSLVSSAADAFFKRLTTETDSLRLEDEGSATRIQMRLVVTGTFCIRFALDVNMSSREQLGPLGDVGTWRAGRKAHVLLQVGRNPCPKSGVDADVGAQRSM